MCALEQQSKFLKNDKTVCEPLMLSPRWRRSWPVTPSASVAITFRTGTSDFFWVGWGWGVLGFTVEGLGFRVWGLGFGVDVQSDVVDFIDLCL